MKTLKSGSNGHGGKRAGAGKPKGMKHAATISKEQARDALRQIVLQHMEVMTAAQVAQATGLKYLVTRDKKTGKFIRVGPAMAAAADTEQTIEVWEKDPSTPAYADLLNRALGKPAEEVHLAGAEGGPLVVRWEG